ncbi:MAG: alpha/beta fold hydrolase [Gammaproteobacteria bacterium]|nr:alpha/beta fold hydrolase [Gammaproteobacteria bacterium]
MKLHYQIVGSGQPVVILHGLFGSSDNWRGLAKELSNHAQVITVDLRNHGRSPHSAEQSYELMADDLAELIQELKLSSVDLIGHSVGGKVAMTFSQHYPEFLHKLVVVDIAPRAYTDEHSTIFETLLGLDLSLYLSRKELDQELSLSLPNKAVRQFLLMNLDLTNDKLTWRLNLHALFECYPKLLQSVCNHQQIAIPSYFIRGGRSNYIGDDDFALINATFPHSEIVTIEEAGHWVHAEAPDIFLTKIIEFFDYD